VNTITKATRRRKAQFYLVEHFPMTLVDACQRLFPEQVPPFKWVIAVVSDVRADVRRGEWSCCVPAPGRCVSRAWVSLARALGVRLCSCVYMCVHVGAVYVCALFLLCVCVHVCAVYVRA
jgi:hypothetical protein